MDGDNQNRDGALPTEIAGRLVTPAFWPHVCQNRLAFGLVVARAFELCGPLRVLDAGLVIERELTEDETLRVRERLDEEADRAFDAHSALRELRDFTEFGDRDMRQAERR